jgi:phage terminase large subunit
MAGRTLRIETAKAFEPLLKPSRYKGAWGGRGSGKSHFFAALMVEDALRAPGETGEGMRGVCIREVQKDLTQSAKLLIEDKLAAFRLGEADGFKVFKDVIEAPKDGLIIFKGMNQYSAESIKSLENFGRAWWEEAHTASPTSLELLRPTMRQEGSELWFGWNPRRKTDPVNKLFRGGKPPTGAISIQANWRDNPWFPKVLEQERKDCLQNEAERYKHIWEGDYATAHASSYYAVQLAKAEIQGRVTDLALDPLMEIKAFWDLGGAGATADAMAIWIAQFAGERILVFDYIEGIGQTLAYYVSELRKRGWGDAHCYLPHDGMNTNSITGKRYKTHLEEAGFLVEVIKNQGKGAAMQRVDATRRLFPKIWFNATTTESGREALGYYHEKRDENRDVGLGPSHDWASHCADAFGLMGICYMPPRSSIRPENVVIDTVADPLVNY